MGISRRAFGCIFAVVLVGLDGLAGAVAADAVPPPDQHTVTLAATGAEQLFTVPSLVTSLHVTLVGAPGATSPDGGGHTGGAGGFGAVVEADLTVSPGQTLYVEVGTAGALGTGGYNGGGNGATPAIGSHPNNVGVGGGGGGASDVRTVTCGTSVQCHAGGTTAAQASRLLVAGGGGGGGAVASGAYAANGAAGGGAGGAAPTGTQGAGADGSDGGSVTGNANAGGGHGGGGATTSAAGTAGAQGAHSYPGGAGGTPGADGHGGNGGRNLSNGGGGGGGGYFGGGGGGSGGDDFNYAEGGGGGGGAGSSWADPGSASGVSIAPDATGPPLVRIAYRIQPAGFDVVGAAGHAVELTAGGTNPALVVAPGERLTLTGAGLQPGSAVAVALHSVPQMLGTSAAGGDGRFTVPVTIPVTATAGAHLLVVTATSADGTPLTRSAALLVEVLPTTGRPLLTHLLVALAALAAGGIAMAWGRGGLGRGGLGRGGLGRGGLGPGGLGRGGLRQIDRRR